MQLCGREVGLGKRLFLIAGPCVIESERLCLDIEFDEGCTRANLDVPQAKPRQRIDGPGTDE